MVTNADILTSMSNIDQMLRTLDGVEPLFRDSGELDYYVGNLAVVFRVKISGEVALFKCYVSSNQHLSAIYGDRFYPCELLVFTIAGESEWVDVVVDEWREGVTLLQVVGALAESGSSDKIEVLARTFDSFALDLLSQEWAHGDITLENIIVGDDGALNLIDFDAMYLPCFSGESCCEVGTEAFQHPSRDDKTFDKSIDDYPIVLISTGLHLLAMEPQLFADTSHLDNFLFHPKDITRGRSPLYKHTLELFAQRGMASQYRVAQMLTSNSYRLPQLLELLAYSLRDSLEDEPCDTLYHNGYWGYRSKSGEVVIPAIYDSAFDFSCSVAAVKIDKYWHYIDTKGELALNCSDCTAVKPARDGAFRVLRGGTWIDV